MKSLILNNNIFLAVQVFVASCDPINTIKYGVSFLEYHDFGLILVNWKGRPC